MIHENGNHQQGQLWFRALELRGLGNDEGIDVYIVINFEKQMIRSSTNYSVVPGGTPLWQEAYTFDVTIPSACLTVTVWGVSHSNPAGQIIGVYRIAPMALLGHKMVDMWAPLVPLTLSNASGLVRKPLSHGNPELRLQLHYSQASSPVGLQDFVTLKLVGKGAFGKVLLVKKQDTQRLYAMKVLNKEMLVQSRAVANTMTEKELLKRFDHPNIVSLKYCFQTATHLYMVLDYISGGELFYHLGELGNFSESRARFYASQIILAIGFLHEHGIIYRDLKPENLLLDMNGDICLCDFGLAKEIYQSNDLTHTFCGSLEYMAPEVLKGEGYGRAVDWWSLGTIIYELLTGLPPFYSENPVHMQDKILNAPLILPDHLSPAAKDLLTRLLHRNAQQRLGGGSTDAAEIRSHPFFAHTDWLNMLLKRVEPPFKPHLLDEEDTRYFDPECTTANPTIATAEILSNDALTQQEQQAFDGFSYTSPLELLKSSCEILPPLTPAPEEELLDEHDFMYDGEDDTSMSETLPSYYISPIPQMERPKPRKTTSLAQIITPTISGITITASPSVPSLVSSKSTPNLSLDMVTEPPSSNSNPIGSKNSKTSNPLKSLFKRKSSSRKLQKQK